MRFFTAALVASFFLPVVCEVQANLRAPQHPCGQTDPRPQPKTDQTCCLVASLERPLFRDSTERQSAVHASALVALSPLVVQLPVPSLDRGARFAATNEVHAPPLPLYLRNSFLLI